MFAIDSFGNITVAKELDRETKSTYELTVTAQDRAGASSFIDAESNEKSCGCNLYLKKVGLKKRRKKERKRKKKNGLNKRRNKKQKQNEEQLRKYSQIRLYM